MLQLSIKQIIKKYSYTKKNQDTGSPESQAAIFTYRIRHLSKHLDLHKKDNFTRKSLISFAKKRNSILAYLKKKNQTRYIDVCKQLDIRIK